MRFNGANAAEQFDLSANGNRLRFFRDVGNITMDTAGVEQVDFNALGGADLVTVNDLTGTDVSSVNVDLAGTLGGSNGDGQPDRVVVNATDGDDTIDVSGDAGGRESERSRADGRDPPPGGPNDQLEVDTLPARTPWTPPAWPPARSSSSWTARSSRRELQTESRGPVAEAPRSRFDSSTPTERIPMKITVFIGLAAPRRRSRSPRQRQLGKRLGVSSGSYSAAAVASAHRPPGDQGRRRELAAGPHRRRRQGPHALPVREGQEPAQRLLRTVREVLAAAAYPRKARRSCGREAVASRHDPTRNGSQQVTYGAIRYTATRSTGSRAGQRRGPAGLRRRLGSVSPSGKKVESDG